MEFAMSGLARSEFAQALTVLWCAATYWLGGQELPILNRGYKQIRRYVMPVGLMLALWYMGADRDKACLACIGLSVACHVGYQANLLKYALTGVLMALPSLVLGPSWALWLPMLSHAGFGYASLKDNRFKWAFVAIIQGASIGLCYILAFSS